MTEVIVFAVAILWLMLIWIKMWQNTFLDNSRDKLFDLRQEVRQYFVSKGIPLDNPVYVNLRMLINKQIRYLEDLTIFDVVSFANIHNKRLINYLERRVNKLFDSDDQELNDFTKKIRQESVNVLLTHMFQTSLLLISLTLMVATIIFIGNIFKSLSISLKAFRGAFFKVADSFTNKMLKRPSMIEEAAFYST